MKDIKKYFLDYSSVNSYVQEHLESGQTLANTILKNCNFKEGKFYTFLPENAKLDQLYSFSKGGIIPQDKEIEIINFREQPALYQALTNTEDKVVSFIFKFLNEHKEGCIFLEDTLLRKNDKGINKRNVELFFYGQEVYYRLLAKNSFEEVEDTVKSTIHVWQFVSILVPRKIELTQDLNECQIKELASSLKFIIIVAYDGESFIFWEKR